MTPRVTVSGLGLFTLELDVSDGVNVTACSTTVEVTGPMTVPAELSRIATPLWLVKQGTGVLFSWEDRGDLPTAYNVYEGDLARYDTHAPLSCGEPGTAVGAGRREASLTPGAGSRYYLMTASSCFAEGTSGADDALSTCPP